MVEVASDRLEFNCETWPLRPLTKCAENSIRLVSKIAHNSELNAALKQQRNHIGGNLPVISGSLSSAYANVSATTLPISA